MNKTTNPDGSPRGFIASTASVADTVYIGANVQIYGNVRISDNVLISGNVQISDNVRIYGNVQIYGNVRIYDNVLISGYTWISGGLWLHHNVVVNKPLMVVRTRANYELAYVDCADGIKRIIGGCGIDTPENALVRAKAHTNPEEREDFIKAINFLIA